MATSTLNSTQNPTAAHWVSPLYKELAGTRFTCIPLEQQNNVSSQCMLVQSNFLPSQIQIHGKE